MAKLDEHHFVRKDLTQDQNKYKVSLFVLIDQFVNMEIFVCVRVCVCFGVF